MGVNQEKLREAVGHWIYRLEKYKYAVLVLLLGAALMLFPKREAKETEARNVPEFSVQQDNLETRLSQLLSQVEGAGTVQVVLTLETGTVYEYQTDLQTRTDSSGAQQEKKTVLASSGSGTEQAVVTKTIYPVYKGAVVVCEGADRPAVKLALVQAVSSLTGLGSDKITVIKMK